VNTFLGDLEFSALRDLDRLDWLVALSFRYVLDLVDNVVAIDDFTEDNVAAIEPAGDDSGDEELRAERMLAKINGIETARLPHLYPFQNWPC
jgi:hypothetical protein